MLLAAVGIVASRMLEQLTTASWQASVLILILIGPAAVLLTISPRPARSAAVRTAAATVLAAAIFIGAVSIDWGGSSNSGQRSRVAGDCDPAYKGACVPRYPPDVNCDEINATNFRSVGNDPHGLDSDGDGVACES